MYYLCKHIKCEMVWGDEGWGEVRGVCIVYASLGGLHPFSGNRYPTEISSNAFCQVRAGKNET